MNFREHTNLHTCMLVCGSVVLMITKPMFQCVVKPIRKKGNQCYMVEAGYVFFKSKQCMYM